MTQTARNKICRHTSEIAAFLDGELSAQSEAAFEKHSLECRICAAKLNEQKRLLCALDFALADEKQLKLPPDFAKTVAVRAEADVSGLLSKKERLRALLIIAGLFFAGASVGVAGGKAGFFDFLADNFFAPSAVLVEIVGRFFYHAAIGISVVCRIVGRQFLFASPLSALVLIFLMIVFFVILSLLLRFFETPEKALGAEN
jgi:hypothetical protein